MTEWLLHSPRRLALVCAAVLAVLVLAGLRLGDDDAGGAVTVVEETRPPSTPARTAAPAPAPSATPSPSATPAPAPTATKAATGPTGAAHGQHNRPNRDDITHAARVYLDTFFDRDLPGERWRSRLADWSTDALADLNDTVPRATVPNTTVEKVTVTRSASSAATVHATLADHTTLDVGLVLDTGGWKVSRVVPGRETR